MNRLMNYGADGKDQELISMLRAASGGMGHPVVPEATETQQGIIDVCAKLRSLLLDKNRKYGDSAVHPARILSRSDPLEQLRVRIDDKLNRIRNAQTDEDEDVYWDLAGYFVLYLVARDQQKEGTEI